MKKYEIREEFILEAHKSACSEWKAKIEKEFPDAFKTKFEYNKWYKDDNYPKWIVFYENKNRIYGLDANGNWFENANPVCVDNEDNCLATPKEVEDALIKEAVKRGFKYEKNILSVDNVKEKIGSGFWIADDGSFWNNGFSKNICLMKNGTWASIQEQPKEVLITMEEIAKLKGCSVEQIKIMK